MRADKPKALEFSKMSDAELIDLTHQGNKVIVLMQEKTFFTEKVIPALEAEADRVREGLEWKPSMTAPTADGVALDRAWKSGILIGMNQLWVTLNDFKNSGKEAAAELERREKKKEKEQKHG